jgi:hypothetical protein
VSERPSISGWVLACVICALTGATAHAQTSLPSAVKDALQENARALNPISIDWERTRTSDLPMGSLLDRIKYSKIDIHILQPERAGIKWHTGGFRSFYHRFRPRLAEKRGTKTGFFNPHNFDIDDPGNFYPFNADRSWDGVVYYNANPSTGPEPAILLIDRVERIAKATPGRVLLEPEYSDYSGFHLPHLAVEMREEKEAKSLPLYMADHGWRIDAAALDKGENGSLLLKLSMSNKETKKVDFYLDPQLHYAVRKRIEHSSRGELALEIRCTDFVRVEGTVLHLPKSVRADWHTWVTIPDVITKPALFHETFKVEKVSHAAIDDGEFVLKYRDPGTMIRDSTVPDAREGKPVHYRVPAKP